MKKFINLSISLSIVGMLLTNSFIAFGIENSQVVMISLNSKIANVNGEDVVLSIEPYVQEPSESMMIPLRFVSTALGISNDNIDYDKNTKKINIKNKDKTISFVANTDTMYIDDKEYKMVTKNGDKNMPIYTQIKNGTTFIPLRALEVGFGVQINWEASTKTAIFINNQDLNNQVNVKDITEQEYLNQQKNNGYPILSEEERETMEQEIIRLTNIERQKIGAPPVIMDKNLMKFARQKAQDMADNNYFNHISPNLGAPVDVVKSNNISFNCVSENISAGQKTPQSVVEAWLNSPTHRENLLNPELKYIGVGMGINSNSKFHYYWSQQFIG